MIISGIKGNGGTDGRPDKPSFVTKGVEMTDNIELEEIFINEIRGKTVTPAQDHILDWAEKRLKPAILAWHQAQLAKLEKAYGNCHKCYGKGYATVRKGTTYRGATSSMHDEINPCDCDRGKQLIEVLHKTEVATRDSEQNRIFAVLKGGKV